MLHWAEAGRRLAKDRRRRIDAFFIFFEDSVVKVFSAGVNEPVIRSVWLPFLEEGTLP